MTRLHRLSSCALGAALLLATAYALTAQDPAGRHRFNAGVGAGTTWFPSFEGRVADQPGLASASADQAVIAWGGFLEYRPPWLPARFGLGATFTSQDFAQAYSSADPLVPTRTTGRVSGQFFDFYGGYDLFENEGFRFGLMLGLTLAMNDLSSTSSFGWGPDATTSRSYSGLQGIAGVDLDFPILDRLHGRVGASWSSGTSQPNADTQGRLFGRVHLPFTF